MIRPPRLIPYVLIWATVLLAALLAVANVLVIRNSGGRTFADIAELPDNRVGLLLGTAKYTTDGRLNPFFENRINAAVDLLDAGKIRAIIASGDNGQMSYNEPWVMKRELISRGVPEDRIYLDYAGFSTLDSIVRVNRIFGQTRFTVISQRFQNQRAVFIARFYHLDAVGYDARDVRGAGAGRVHIREYLARVKAFLDLYILNTQPRYLGRPVELVP